MRTITFHRPLLIIVAVLLYCGTLATAQERPRTVRSPDLQSNSDAALKPDDTVRVNTRVVFIDALVKDQKTYEPIRDLAREDFQVLDDGNLRRLSYFSREGDSRRPLALLLFIDLWTQYGRSHLKRDETMQRLASALTKLAPEDKVAVMVTWIEEGEEPGTPLPTTQMIEDFTPDRAKTTAALLSIPGLVRQQEGQLEELAQKSSQEAGDLRLDIIWRLSEVAGEIMPLAARFPKSQLVVVGLIDDLFDLRKGEREGAVEEAVRAGIIFDGLIFKKSLAAKMLFGTLNKIMMGPRGLSIHAADYLAKQTGGEVVSVGRPDDLASGLERFITSLMARYNLGFSLEEREPDAGRMHKLEVKVKARDGQGKQRKLVVNARRGYYLPKVRETPTAR
ncbi:MAG: VWA domain-containing protein [Acidobacteriota bacterium]|nr:VWA domain-containing protein [Acidobacteriota bacterium]